MKLQFSIQLFSSLNKQGLEELASVMGGRLNFTLEQSTQFDLDSIPEATADELNDLDEPLESLDAIEEECETKIAEDATDASRQAD